MTVDEIKKSAIKSARKVKKEDLEEAIEFYKPTAQEMFEKLGYEKIEDNECWIEFSSKFVMDTYTQDEEEVTITFDKKFQTIEKWNTYLKDGSCYLSMEELQAINKQCKELGWI